MEIVSRSDRGRVRTNNEDAVAIGQSEDVAVLADGMGGLNAGEVAATLAVQRVLQALPSAGSVTEETLRDAVRQANLAVFERSRSKSDYAMMGTTLVVWVHTGGRACLVANVGDSRGYQFADGTLSRITHDHSLVQELVDDGLISAEEALTAPNRNIITRAVGLDAKVDVDVFKIRRVPGDLILLCSDGLTDLVHDPAITRILNEAASIGLEVVADKLIATANQAGGLDNITVVLIR
ncbi:MAG: Stp1/IreP family PP2C-type Ser/Thr phosphatase [Proteobacteria bacterium]|nr:Stp1/IreP family PP2C-type Ser/Thr phosphatase [Pseudomonadota bacterium]